VFLGLYGGVLGLVWWCSRACMVVFSGLLWCCSRACMVIFSGLYGGVLGLGMVEFNSDCGSFVGPQTSGMCVCVGGEWGARISRLLNCL